MRTETDRGLRFLAWKIRPRAGPGAALPLLMSSTGGGKDRSPMHGAFVFTVDRGRKGSEQVIQSAQIETTYFLCEINQRETVPSQCLAFLATRHGADIFDAMIELPVDLRRYIIDSARRLLQLTRTRSSSANRAQDRARLEQRFRASVTAQAHLARRASL